MASGGHDRSVNDRGVVCSVCLEPYRGRQPKLLPCYHTFCLPCLTKLAHTQPQKADNSSRNGGEGDQKTGKTNAPLVISCPTCRTIVPVPPGGVADFQANFYVDGDGESSPPLSSTRDIREQIKNQIKVVEAVLARLKEEEVDISRQRRSLDDDVQTRYEEGLGHLADARDQSLISLREAAQAVHDKLEADKMFAKMLLTNLTQACQDSAERSTKCLLNDAMLRHFAQIATRTDSTPFFRYIPIDNNAAFNRSLSDFMGRVVPFGKTVDTVEHSSSSSREASLENTQGCTNTNHSEMTTMRQELVDMQSQLRQDINSVMSENTRLSKDFRMLHEDVRGLYRNLTDICNTNNKHLGEVGVIQQDITILQQDLNASKADNGRLNTLLESFRKDVEDLRKMFEQQKPQHAELSTELASLQKDLAKTKTVPRGLAEMREELKEIKTGQIKLGADISDLQEKYQLMDTTSVELKVQMDTAKQNISLLQRDTVALKGDTSVLQKEAAAVHELEKKVDALEELRLELDSIQEQQVDLEVLRKLQTDVETLQSECVRLTAVTAESVTPKDLKEKPKQGSTEMMPPEDMEQVAKANSSEIIRLRHDMTSLQTHNTHIRHELNTIHNTSTQLTLDVRTLEKDVSSIHQVMTFVQAENGRLASDYMAHSNRVEAVEVTNQEIKTDLDALTSKMENILTNVEEIRENNTHHMDEMSSLQKTITILQNSSTSMHDWNDKALKDMARAKDDISTLLTDVRLLKADLGSVTRKTEKIFGWGDGPALRKDLDTLQGQIRTIQASLRSAQDALSKSTQVVAFHAKLPSFVISSKPQPLVLRDVVTNLGGGYDPQTGIFTAPVSGTYLFMATTSPNIWGNVSKSRFAIMVDDKEQGRAWAQGDNSSTGVVVAEVNAGQRVWMQSKGNDYYFAGSGLTYFCGVLVRRKLN